MAPKYLCLAVFAGLASSCGEGPPAAERPAAEPLSPKTEVTPSAEATPVSIIRADVEQPEAVAVLDPLEISIAFPDGGARLSAEAQAQLESLLQSPQMAAGDAIVLRGHSDSAGSDAANLRASTVRAEAVHGWLVGKGVDEARITLIAFGEQNPIRPNALPDGSANEAGRAANRRVDVTVLVSSEEPEERPAKGPQGETGTVSNKQPGS